MFLSILGLNYSKNFYFAYAYGEENKVQTLAKLRPDQKFVIFRDWISQKSKFPFGKLLFESRINIFNRVKGMAVKIQDLNFLKFLKAKQK